MVQTRTPRTLAKNRGRTLWSMSLETSVRKLVAVATQTLRCRRGGVALTGASPKATR